MVDFFQRHGRRSLRPLRAKFWDSLVTGTSAPGPLANVPVTRIPRFRHNLVTGTLFRCPKSVPVTSIYCTCIWKSICANNNYSCKSSWLQIFVARIHGGYESCNAQREYITHSISVALVVLEYKGTDSVYFIPYLETKWTSLFSVENNLHSQNSAQIPRNRSVPPWVEGSGSRNGVTQRK